MIALLKVINLSAGKTSTISTHGSKVKNGNEVNRIIPFNGNSRRNVMTRERFLGENLVSQTERERLIRFPSLTIDVVDRFDPIWLAVFYVRRFPFSFPSRSVSRCANWIFFDEADKWKHLAERLPRLLLLLFHLDRFTSLKSKNAMFSRCVKRRRPAQIRVTRARVKFIFTPIIKIVRCSFHRSTINVISLLEQQPRRRRQAEREKEQHA